MCIKTILGTFQIGLHKQTVLLSRLDFKLFIYMCTHTPK